MRARIDPGAMIMYIALYSAHATGAIELLAFKHIAQSVDHASIGDMDETFFQ